MKGQESKVLYLAAIGILVIVAAIFAYQYFSASSDLKDVEAQNTALLQSFKDYGTAVAYEENANYEFGRLIGKYEQGDYSDALDLLPRVKNGFREAEIQLAKVTNAPFYDQSLKADMNTYYRSLDYFFIGIEQDLKISLNEKYTSLSFSQEDKENYIAEMKENRGNFVTAKEIADKIQHRTELGVLTLINAYDAIINAIDKQIAETEKRETNENQIIVEDQVLNIKSISGHWIGNENAQMWIVQFGDFDDTFNNNFYSNTWPKIKSTYIDTGKARFAFAHFPLSFHDNAVIAANAAECAAEQGKFWEMHDLLYKNYPTFNQAKFYSLAESLGLDQGQFSTCYESRKYDDVISADYDVGIDAGVEGTPSFFIRGTKGTKFIVGAYQYPYFEEAINGVSE
ncbi:MAG: thioredoxin domain-containing protein [Candidatus Diapherotrites archaeon]|nr:thioredoxin domain-containing protein [Candidatus Diapherotrites archaeon]